MENLFKKLNSAIRNIEDLTIVGSSPGSDHLVAWNIEKKDGTFTRGGILKPSLSSLLKGRDKRDGITRKKSDG